MLVYLLIFSVVVLGISGWGFFDFVREPEPKDVGAIWFFGALAAASGVAVGFSIALLANG